MCCGKKHGALFFFWRSHLSPPYTHHMIDVGFVSSTVCDDIVLSLLSSITNSWLYASWPANNLGIFLLLCLLLTIRDYV